MESKEVELKSWIFHSFQTDNYIAYRLDLFRDNPSELSEKQVLEFIKMTNFTPIYDHVCLFCDKKDVQSQCSKCKSVYFCDANCQLQSWKIHKRSCGRNLFTICCSCGSEKPSIKCNNCPTRFCNKECQEKITKIHQEDCQHLKSIFGQD